MANKPYMPVYVGDWLRDPRLTLCSPPTRGIYFDLLLNIYDDNQDGTITGTLEQLARLGRCNIHAAMMALVELHENRTADFLVNGENIENDFRGHILKDNAKITIINRRLARELKTRKSNRMRQRRFIKNGQNNGKITPPISISVSNSKDNPLKSPKKMGGCSGSRKKQFDPMDLSPWPDHFRTHSEFQKAWEQFVDYRKQERGKPITARAGELLRKKLAAIDPSGARVALENSISNSWTGVFPDKTAAMIPAPKRLGDPTQKTGERDPAPVQCKKCQWSGDIRDLKESSPGSLYFDQCPNPKCGAVGETIEIIKGGEVKI